MINPDRCLRNDVEKRSGISGREGGRRLVLHVGVGEIHSPCRPIEDRIRRQATPTVILKRPTSAPPDTSRVEGSGGRPTLQLMDRAGAAFTARRSCDCTWQPEGERGGAWTPCPQRQGSIVREILRSSVSPRGTVKCCSG